MESVQSAAEANFLHILIGKGRKDPAAIEFRKKYGFRGLDHIHMWTHVFLVAGAIAAYVKEHYELSLLVMFVTTMSLQYHREAEPPASVNTAIEGALARLLFLGGLFQLFLVDLWAYLGHGLPSNVFWAEIAAAGGLAASFIFTNLYKEWYDPYHSGVHIFGGILLCIMALSHDPRYSLVAKIEKKNIPLSI